MGGNWTIRPIDIVVSKKNNKTIMTNIIYCYKFFWRTILFLLLFFNKQQKGLCYGNNTRWVGY